MRKATTKTKSASTGAEWRRKLQDAARRPADDPQAGGACSGLPPEAIAHLDAAIEIVNNENSLQMAGFRPFFEVGSKNIEDRLA